MFIQKNFDKLLILIFFTFSCWFMWKSFGYDTHTHEFIIARNEVGDFGLHLSLIRSFSWGRNFPVESPFYPGKPLPYHYLVDVIVGLLERSGVRIDIAYNGLSALAFTLLLFLIYLLPQKLFGKNKFVGLVSVALFVLHSSLTFVDFFRSSNASSVIKDIWHLPNYIHMGPFDGSLISIFFTPAVFLNQRHLIVGLMMSLYIMYTLIPLFIYGRIVQKRNLFVVGVLLGILSMVHSLIFAGTCVVVLVNILQYRKINSILSILLPAFFISVFRFIAVVQTSSVVHLIWNPGFLSIRPLSFGSFIEYWWVNLGIAPLVLLCGVVASHGKQRLFFISVLSLFVIANLFQFSYRIDHNHSLINLFVIFGNFYIAYFLNILAKKGFFQKLGVGVCLMILTASGILDLMAVKNDFQLRVADAQNNSLMSWIKDQTRPSAIFLSQPMILDPVTLAGRKNYLGHDYYLSVMGYDYGQRTRDVKRYFEASDERILPQMQKAKIEYVILPNHKVEDFPYIINFSFWEKYSHRVYKDKDVTVYKL